MVGGRRAGIDHADTVTGADDIYASACIGEGPGIVGDNTDDQGAELLCNPIIEGEIFDEWNAQRPKPYRPG